MVLGWIIGSTFLISLIAFIGVLTFAMREKLLNKILLFLVALSAGALIGGAFLHLIPEAIEGSDSSNVFIFILAGFIMFFFVEKILHWRHCHKGRCEVHTFAHMSLFGDFVHNFIDGLVIAASFIVDTRLGITTVLAIALHEIPQEIGDFGVLIYGGFKKTKALMINFLIALTVVAGGVAGYFLSEYISIVPFLPFAAGGFIYISASDLIPELRKETDLKKSFLTLFIFLAGIGIMYLLRFLG